MITGTSKTIDELRHVIDHTAPVVPHNGHVNDLVQRIQRGATVGARLSLHVCTRGICCACTTRASNTLVNVLQLEKRDGNWTKGICICATTGCRLPGPKHEYDELHCGISTVSHNCARPAGPAQKHRSPCQCTATGEELWSAEQQDHGNGPSAPRQEIRRPSRNCNCGDSTVFCSRKPKSLRKLT